MRAYVLPTTPVGFRHTPELRNCPLCGQFRDRAQHRLRERTGVKAEGMSFAHPFATGAVSRRGTAARGRSPKPNRPTPKAAHERGRSRGPLQGCRLSGSEKVPVPRCLKAKKHRAPTNILRSKRFWGKRVRAYVLPTTPVGFRHTPELRNCPLCGQFRDRAQHRLRERASDRVKPLGERPRAYKVRFAATWYRRADSNRYALRHRILSPARLPISPRRYVPLL